MYVYFNAVNVKFEFSDKKVVNFLYRVLSLFYLLLFLFAFPLHYLPVVKNEAKLSGNECWHLVLEFSFGASFSCNDCSLSYIIK